MYEIRRVGSSLPLAWVISIRVVKTASHLENLGQQVARVDVVQRAATPEQGYTNLHLPAVDQCDYVH